MHKRNFYNGADPRALSLYSVHEAAHYLGIASSTLRGWISGRRYETQAGVAFTDPLIRLPDGSDGRISFNNLVEAHVLKALRQKHAAPMAAIRKALDYAERELGIERLLLQEHLRTGAGDLFWTQLSELINLSRGGQIAMREMVEWLVCTS